MLRLTAQPAFNTIYLATTCLKSGPVAYRTGEQGFDQREAVFAYARMPNTIVDAAIQKLAIEAVRNDADSAAAAAKANTWGLLALRNAGQPGAYSAFPAMSLIHGHYLHRNGAYLEALVAHASYMLGANPANTCYVSGLGADADLHVRHAGNRSTSQPMPPRHHPSSAHPPKRPNCSRTRWSAPT